MHYLVYNNQNSSLFRKILHLAEPPFGIFNLRIKITITTVYYNNDTVGTTIVCFGNRLELFLPRLFASISQLVYIPYPKFVP